MRVLVGLAKLVIATVLAGVLVAGLLLPSALGLGLAANRVSDTIAATPLPDMTQPFPERSTFTDSSGKPFAYFYTQNRVVVPKSQISDNLKLAIIATEDRRFLDHSGVDPRGTLRAILKDSNSDGSGQQGGSTLTQQYVKNYRLLVLAKTPAERADAIAASPLRKLQEAKIALVIGKTMSKDDILYGYLNLVAFAPNVYGAEAASDYYFGEHASDLTIPQAALLAGMVKNPVQYNPLSRDPSVYQAAIDRKNTVISLLAANGVIPNNAATIKALQNQDLGLSGDRHASPNGCQTDATLTTGFFCQYVVDFLQNYQKLPDDLDRGGYTIKTTLDQRAMTAAHTAVLANADPNAQGNGSIANVMAVVKPGVGIRKVLALTANHDYGSQPGQTLQRLPTTFAPLGAGSAFKIFTAAEALKQGLGTQSTIDSPATYTNPALSSRVFGNPGTFPSTMTLSRALATSPNTPFLELENELGLQNVADMSVALGLRGYNLNAGDVDATYTNTSLTYAQEVQSQKMQSFTLGVSPVSPVELANVGATLASDGQWCQPTPVDTITDRDGQVLATRTAPCEQVVDKELAHALTDAMQGDFQKSGTAYQAAQQTNWTRTAAGKSGTTLDYKSSSFLGFTPFYSAVAMTWDYGNQPQAICVDAKTHVLAGSCKFDAQGNPTDKSLVGMSGATVPAVTWMQAIGALEGNDTDTPFPPPTNGDFLSGSTATQVPDLTNMDISDAQALLAQKGFKLNSPPTVAPGVPANRVLSWTPRTTALPGATITVTVASGSVQPAQTSATTGPVTGTAGTGATGTATGTATSPAGIPPASGSSP